MRYTLNTHLCICFQSAWIEACKKKLNVSQFEKEIENMFEPQWTHEMLVRIVSDAIQKKSFTGATALFDVLMKIKT